MLQSTASFAQSPSLHTSSVHAAPSSHSTSVAQSSSGVWSAPRACKEDRVRGRCPPMGLLSGLARIRTGAARTIVPAPKMGASRLPGTERQRRDCRGREPSADPATRRPPTSRGAARGCSSLRSSRRGSTLRRAVLVALGSRGLARHAAAAHVPGARHLVAATACLGLRRARRRNAGGIGRRCPGHLRRRVVAAAEARDDARHRREREFLGDAHVS